ncbi:GIY-YIG nuclease family protein [Budvicia aquatica]|uniref:GIY-YIG nuclease family protein n=1 Tax=Budvicia aquatica TaxID=82979 RepID=UPI002087ADBC|nr:GIY-YIG nuclease family protein [Budvicia aquatica]GKX51547.1 hypothetical protein SOASR029_18560 [Budvicia aquatica]
MGGGWIYVFMTASDYNRYKVGLTRNNPMLRLNQLKTADPMIAFQVAYFIPNSLDVKLSVIEKMIHQELGVPVFFWNEEPSEWFYGEPRDVWSKLDDLFEMFGFEVTDYFDPDGKKVVRFWEESLNAIYAPPLPMDEDGFPLF